MENDSFNFSQSPRYDGVIDWKHHTPLCPEPSPIEKLLENPRGGLGDSLQPNFPSPLTPKPCGVGTLNPFDIDFSDL